MIQAFTIKKIDTILRQTILRVRNDPSNSNKLNWINEGFGILAEEFMKDLKKEADK